MRESIDQPEEFGFDPSQSEATAFFLSLALLNRRQEITCKQTELGMRSSGGPYDERFVYECSDDRLTNRRILDKCLRLIFSFITLIFILNGKL